MTQLITPAFASAWVGGHTERGSVPTAPLATTTLVGASEPSSPMAPMPRPPAPVTLQPLPSSGMAGSGLHCTTKAEPAETVIPVTAAGAPSNVPAGALTVTVSPGATQRLFDSTSFEVASGMSLQSKVLVVGAAVVDVVGAAVVDVVEVGAAVVVDVVDVGAVVVDVVELPGVVVDVEPVVVDVVELGAVVDVVDVEVVEVEVEVVVLVAVVVVAGAV
jgi:hypothetical protein